MRTLIIFVFALSFAGCAVDFDGSRKCANRPNSPKKYRCSQYMID
jgi:hypothetical protein